MLSIIIPTYNEKTNVCKVAERISQAMVGEAIELIFVDDSTDETPAILAELAREKPEVSYLHRSSQRGLATAVVTGFQLAKGEILTVLDADLQHPPELLPILLKKLRLGSDIVIPSRFVAGGSDGGLTLSRKIIARTARALTWLFLKKSRCSTDPMSGFFMLRKKVIQGKALQPVGWKILLEVLVKGDYQRVQEIPYTFQPRAGDQSKMSWREQWNFLRHLGRLFLASPADHRFWKFCLVGASGVLLNLVLYTLLIEVVGVNIVLAGVSSALLALFSNFFFNDRFTWRQDHQQPFLQRLLRFYLYCSIGIMLNTAVLIVLYEILQFNYLLANLLGIITASLWNFTANNKWTWTINTNELLVADSEGMAEDSSNNPLR